MLIFIFSVEYCTIIALCYSLHSTEADCSSAIQLDEKYVKAYHRRATARMGLKQYKEAKQDVEKILTLESTNKEARALLDQIDKQLENPKVCIIIKLCVIIKSIYLYITFIFSQLLHLEKIQTFQSRKRFPRCRVVQASIISKLITIKLDRIV